MKKRRNKLLYCLPFVLLLLFSVGVLLPLLKSGFYSMHDDQQVGRLYSLHQNIVAGHFPPRLAQDFGFGYDYPLFNFYPPFIYYVSLVFKFVGFTYIDATKLMIATGFLLSAFGMYAFSRFYLSRFASFVAAIAYLYAPYHAVDAYVRGALSEFWAFVFIPLIFLSYALLSKYPTIGRSIVAALALTGLIITHNLTALMSGFFIGMFLLYLLWQTNKKKRFLLAVCFSGFLTLCLSAFFWLPALFEKHYTMVDLLTQELANYNLHFVYLRQLWDGQWGYGGSLYGLLDGMSFQIGKLHILSSLLAGVFLAIGLLTKKKTPLLSLTAFFFLLFVFSVFIQSERSKVLWDAFSPLWYVQFPWRFLLFAVFTSSLLMGLCIDLFPKRKVAVGMGIVFLAFIFALYGNYFQPEKQLVNAVDTDYISKETLHWRTSIMSFEYVPKGVATEKSPIGNTVIAIDPSETAKGSYQIVTGDMDVHVLTDRPHEKVFSVSVATPGSLQIHAFSFPGWKTFVNGKDIAYTAENKFKLITIPLSKGDHQVVARFEDTPIRKTGNILTVLSSIFVIGYAGYMVKKKGLFVFHGKN